MKKNAANLAKGIGIGMTVGAVVGIAGSRMMSSNKKLRKTASKAIRSVTNAVSNMQSIMK
ncbi:MAG: hypothetical protein IKY44_00810 [Clostridia bacterium]|nr:hypothetical protein [Clostridia bacterium]